MSNRKSHQPSSASTRLFISLLAGIVAAVAVSVWGSWRFVPLSGWDTAVLVYVLWAGLNALPMSAAATASHAKREDPGRAGADVLLLVASIASLAAVGFLVIQAAHNSGAERTLDIILGLLSVIASWAVVHTTYALKYARLYYGDPEGGIDFNESDPPRYSDFAYLAFTIGMTFQVSDTDLQTKDIRATALKHALLSFLFGTVIIATTINTVVSLSQ